MGNHGKATAVAEIRLRQNRFQLPCRAINE